MRPIHLHPSLALLLAAVLPLARLAADPPDLRTLVPPNVESMIYVPDVRRAVAEFRGSRFGTFYREPAAREFLAPLRETLERDSPELAALLSGDYDSPPPVLTGSLLVARLAPPKKSAEKRGAKSSASIGSGDVRPFVVIFHHNGDFEAAKQLLESTLPKSDRREITKDSANGLNFFRVKSVRHVKDQPIGSKGGEKNRLAASLGSTPGLKVAGREEIVEEHHFVGRQVAIRAGKAGFPIADILGRLRYTSSAPSLAKSPSYLGATAALDNDSPLQIYHDFAAMTQSGRPLVDETLLGRGGDASRLGLEEIKSAAMTLRFAPDRLQAEAHVFIPEPRKGLGRLFFMNAPLADGNGGTTRTLASVLPDRATGYALFNADLGAVWSEFRRIFRESIPAASDLVDSYLDSLSQSLDSDIERDLIAKLGSRWVMFTSPVPGRSRESGVETTYMIEILSQPQMRPVLERWLGKTASTLNYTLDTSAVGDNLYYRLTGAEISEGAFADLKPFAKLCLTPDWLIISPRFEHIQSVVARLEAGEGEPLAPQPWRSAEWSRAVGHLPPNRFLEVWSSPAAFGSFVRDPFFGMFTGLFSGLEDSVVEFNEVPAEDVWGRYFGPAVLSVQSGGDRLGVTLNLMNAEH